MQQFVGGGNCVGINMGVRGLCMGVYKWAALVFLTIALTGHQKLQAVIGTLSSIIPDSPPASTTTTAAMKIVFISVTAALLLVGYAPHFSLGDCSQPASCVGKEENVYAHPECDCKRYYTCRKSVSSDKMIKRERRCTGTKIFDTTTNRCITAGNDNCPTPPPVTTIEPTTESADTTASGSTDTASSEPTTNNSAPTCEQRETCSDGEDVYEWPECNCQRYDICRMSPSSGQLKISSYRCTGGEVFHNVTKQCTSTTSVCPYYVTV
ncbi:putative Chitin binding Peritrophin-A domain-containing protein 3 [Homarus americanus]|uniref:Putative Chitin binding Peritrophin-A domain-containing protein 3 n=1 Tax=Homarus americanus TaxID=6706 RepID=A0A8J5MS63_HOMAM|nr:putative Chitin binding Peritrophin-A domain-containing protein 3 [Homarus americanus]